MSKKQKKLEKITKSKVKRKSVNNPNISILIN